jgi:hypothetical protein
VDDASIPFLPTLLLEDPRDPLGALEDGFEPLDDVLGVFLFVVMGSSDELSSSSDFSGGE